MNGTINYCLNVLDATVMMMSSHIVYIDDALTLLYVCTLIKKPLRVVDMIYEELSVCNILDHENLMVMETWVLDPHLIVLEFVSCIGRSP